MKKTYKTPYMRVAVLDAEQDLLCGSPVGLCSNPALKDEENDATQGSVLVKEKNLWDEEW